MASKRRSSARSSIQLLSTAVLLLPHVALASLPQVDFSRMGSVGLAGAFAGLDLFDNTTSVTFDPSTSTLLSRSPTGALSRLGSTNSGGRIAAGCALNNIFYLAGSFSSISGTSANNIASYTNASGAFAPLGTDGPNGEINAVYCDVKDNKLWVGGKFTSPGASVAVWDANAKSWSAAPFGGLSGAGAEVLSITSNASTSSIFLTGSFISSFQGNASALNNTNNPNVPFSSGATPFSSSLVPIPLQNAQVVASPSSSNPQYNDIQDILCPLGPDGPGNTWFAADGSISVIDVFTYTSLNANGVRLGNTFQPGHGTTGFSVETIPDNKVQTLTFVDPVSGQNMTCTDPCPLGTDPSVPYQDFLFTGSFNITGVQVKLSQWNGTSAGLHILQLLSSGAFASAVDSQNGQSCFAPTPSNATYNGPWAVKVANTNIAGTVQSVLVAPVNVGTSAANGPSFTWMPYVSASGQYDINLLVPGCSDFEDCALRTSVKVTVFPGGGQNPWVTTVSQQNSEDLNTLIYSGPVVPSSPDFVTTITMTLADQPAGKGQGGEYELVADRVQLVLKSANVTGSASGSNGTVGTQGTISGFGFLEWPLSSSAMTNATVTMSNATETALDAVGFDLFNALGGATSLASSSATIAAVAHHSSGAIFLGGTFALTSGTASSASNIVMYRDGSLEGLTDAGLNGPVTSLLIVGDTLFIGGSFSDTPSATTSGKLKGVAMYDIEQGQWLPLDAGVNGAITSLGFNNDQVQVAGNFTTLISATDITSGFEVSGLAAWDVTAGTWANNGGFLVGSMTLVANSTSSSNAQFVAGSVQTSLKFGASGLVMLTNGGGNGPTITPLGVQLDSSPDVVAVTLAKRGKAHHRQGPAAWMPNFSHLFSRQSTPTLPPLPPFTPAPAPAVLTGVFWTNISSSHEVAIIGGNFSFPSSGPLSSQSVAIYDQATGTLLPLHGSQVNGTVRALFVQDNLLFVGGEFTIEGTSANGLAVYDLSSQQWQTSSMQALQAASGSSVVVRSITSSASTTNTVIVAGSFAQAGSLACQSICSWDTSSNQWSALGSGIQGEISAVTYAGTTELIASGSIALSDNTVANIAKYTFSNTSWSAVGSSSQIPGPVTAVEVDNGNSSSIFAAGRSTDGTSAFLLFWNGASWTNLGSSLEGNSNISQLTMVPLQNTHAANGVIEPDRMLLVSGALVDTTFGIASSALFDGSMFIPYIMSSSASGGSGFISSLFSSLSSFSFTQHHYLAVGVVILISIAIAAGVVFFLALIGILWTLFSRRDDKLAKFEGGDDDDDDSTHHRPSSLLDHINAATRNTILGTPSPFGFGGEKDEALNTKDVPNDLDPFAADGSNYLRAETPSDAVAGGMMAADEETSRPAHARYSFDGTGEGELALTAGLEVEILDDRDSAWWYARDVRTGREGVVPASYLY